MRIDDLAAGVVLGSRFRLLKILGRGSYGDVWLADVLEAGGLPPKVALKIYHHQERATRKLLEEARVATSFDHPRLVRVFGAERLEGFGADVDGVCQRRDPARATGRCGFPQAGCPG